ncbi:MAG: two-component regulator propeller domain-containing protein, partial [Bacteroidales bacterium]
MRRLVLAFVLLFLLGSFAEGASVKFHSINAVAGISMRVMNSICEDDQGFIWASSKTGILRLTHEDYRVYELPYETAGVLIVKLLYANSVLTAYTNNGQVFTYNPVFDRFDLLVNLSKALNHSYFDLYSLHADDQGTYWIALSSGLYTYRAGTLTLVESVSGHKYAITPFDDQHMLMASAQGIRLIDIPSLKGEFIYRTRGSEPLSVSSLYFDRKRNQLWIGTMSSGLYGYDFRASTLQPLLRSSFPRQPILAIEESTDSTLLVGVDGQGLWEVSADGRKVWNVYKESADDPYSLRGNGVYDIYRDRNNRIWI